MAPGSRGFGAVAPGPQGDRPGSGGGRRGLIALAVVVAAGVAVVGGVLLLPARGVSSRPVADPVDRATVRLGASTVEDRLAAIHELEGLMWRYESPHQPEVVRVLSAFVRERAPVARCAAVPPAAPAPPGETGDPASPGESDAIARPAEDVEVAMGVLGHRAVAGDEGTVMDLRGVCLAGIVMTYINLERADLRGADLSGATFAGMTLTGVDLAGARLVGADLSQADLVDADLTDAELAGAELTSVRWSGGTTWPVAYERTITRASTRDGATLVVGRLTL